MNGSRSKRWVSQENLLVFVFEVLPRQRDDEGNLVPCIKVEIYLKEKPSDNLFVQLIDTENPVRIDHKFVRNIYLEGSLKLVMFQDRKGKPELGAWADIHYGQRLDYHFEGVMVTWPYPVQPWPPLCPLPPIPPGEKPPQTTALIVRDTGEGDLFPYVYLRKWPRVSAADLEASFVQYTPSSSPPEDAFYQELVQAQTREEREDLALTFINRDAPFQGQFVVSPDDLCNSESYICNFDPCYIRWFSRIDEALREATPWELNKLTALILKILRCDFQALYDYLHAPCYQEQLSRTWQSYFALVIILGYDPNLLDYLTRTIVMANLLAVLIENWSAWSSTGTDPGSPPYDVAEQPSGEAVSTDALASSSDPALPAYDAAAAANEIEDEMTAYPAENGFLTPHYLRGLATATIILPPGVFPLPPYVYSPPYSPPHSRSEGWIEPYAIGDLNMVRRRLLGYVPGEIAYIENVMRGERKEVSRRKLDRFQESRTVEENTDSAQVQVHHEGRINLLSEIEKALQESTVTTNYKNLTTTYGPAVSVTYDGSFDVQTTQGEKPGEEKVSQFARDILSKTVNRIARRVAATRTTTTIDETEETVTSIFDNTGNPRNERGIYRWLNKVYQARLVPYGVRMVIEFVVKKPAAVYIASEAQFQGISFEEPVSLENNGIHTFNSITRGNYARLAAEYVVTDIEPPPPSKRTVSITLHGDEDDQIVIPNGYKAAEAFAAYVAPAGASPPNVLVGQHEVKFTDGSGECQLHGQDTLLPVAVLGEAMSASPPDSSASPPDSSDNYLVTVEVVCRPTLATFDAWQIKTYNALLLGYQKQKAAYFQRSGARLDGRTASMSPLAYRQIEQRELQRGCFHLLMDVNLEKVGPEPSYRNVHGVTEPMYLQFFAEAFEWTEITYNFITRLDEKPGPWPVLVESSNEDSLFTNFLQASVARVRVPLSPEYTLAVLYYLTTGMVWPANPALVPVACVETPVSACANVAIVNELKTATPVPVPLEEECVTWEFVVPTSMRILQDGPELPGCDEPCLLPEGES